MKKYMPHEIFDVSATISEFMLDITSHAASKNILLKTINEISKLVKSKKVNEKMFNYYAKVHGEKILWENFKDIFIEKRSKIM